MLAIYRNCQSLHLPDDDHQFLSPCDARVNQIALEHHVVLGGHRDHDRGIFRPLRFVDGCRIGKKHFVEFIHLILNRAAVEIDYQGPLFEINARNGPISPLKTSLP